MINKNDAEKNNINVIETDNVLIDAKNERIEQIKALLPNVINSDNQIDLKALQDLVGSENTTSNNQGYELTFAGKGLARAKADEPTTKELKAELGQSKNFDTTENVIIRGDNIDSLKILRANYHNKIKMIYIDPPYNTEKEKFIYRDNFKQTDAKLIKDFGLNEDTTNFLDNIYGTRSHSGWLSFMYPRLMLAKDLLRDDGVIFISIDDNEQANLKILCDEIFGERNAAERINWRRRHNQPNDKTKMIGKVSDSIISYFKNIDMYKKSGVGKVPLTGKFSNPDNDPRGDWASKPWKSGDGQSGTRYKITPPKGITFDEEWMGEEELFKKLLKDNRIIFTKDGKGLPRKKYFKCERQAEGQCATNWWSHEVFGHNQEATDELSSLLNNKKNIFDNPKPVKLLKAITNIAYTYNDIILDFFAGSGTTAHAVMAQNAEDGGNRKFILCQLDEEIKPKKSKPAYDFCEANNFEPVISSITIERVNRAGDKIKAAPENEGKNIDIGYKVFSHADKPKIDYDDAQKSFNILNQRANTIDTLYNMLVATCKTLDIKIETIRENAIYKADNEIYVTGKVTIEELKPFKDLKINIDALADIDLKDYLNLDLSFKDNMTVIY